LVLQIVLVKKAFSQPHLITRICLEISVKFTYTTSASRFSTCLFYCADLLHSGSQ